MPVTIETAPDGHHYPVYSGDAVTQVSNTWRLKHPSSWSLNRAAVARLEQPWYENVAGRIVKVSSTLPGYRPPDPMRFPVNVPVVSCCRAPVVTAKMVALAPPPVRRPLFHVPFALGLALFVVLALGGLYVISRFMEHLEKRNLSPAPRAAAPGPRKPPAKPRPRRRRHQR